MTTRDVLKEIVFNDCPVDDHSFIREKCWYCDKKTDTILAALDAAGLVVVPKALFKIKLSDKSMDYLDDMAEAEEAMNRKPALRILLNHYRAMIEAAKEEGQ